MTHPRDMGAKQVEAFLTMLATERKVSASTHNQALSALLFLYREVLEEDLPWLSDINRPAQVRRIPSVLTKDEVAGLLAAMDGVTALLARFLRSLHHLYQASPPNWSLSDSVGVTSTTRMAWYGV